MTITQRKRGAERRSEILAAALRVLGQRGASGLTTSALAHEVGLTTGALFRHFRSREEILNAGAHDAVSRLETTFPDPSGPPLDRLLELARNRVRLLGGNGGLRWFLISEEALLVLSPTAQREIRTVVKRSRRFLLDALTDAAGEGSIRTDLEPDQLLVPVMGTIHAAIGLGGAHRRAAVRDRATDQVLGTLATLLRPSPPAPPRHRTRRSP
jgi:AcrR family transcriptional regulator